ncbi:HAD-IB family hydrolase [Microbulbifer litoralis]|uniref:HAD-IB family hydrolase n=1 Tax=Microbulbifer litoralis TaxID=2933965 RepID=UPI002027B81D|nr:HAD-IB family hydrolase [Microbulbifer sp. GX H0434]
MTETGKPVVAVYDFDGTITDRHTFWRFLRLLSGPWKFWFTTVTMIPWIIGIYYRNQPVMSAREVLIRRLLKGIDEQRFLALSRRFALEQIPDWVRADALRSFEEHQSRGHRLLLVSNSAASYLRPWAASVGIDTVFGSEFEVDGRGRLTGELLGTHCQGPEKLRCLEFQLGDLDRYELHVYGDSEGDLAMLDAADFAYYLTFDPLHRNDQRSPAPLQQQGAAL